jgi:hypothetical protein
MTNLITISSTVPATVSKESLAVVARWKNGKNPDGTAKIVADANRVRSVILPATIWTADVESDNKPLQLFILDAVAELAKDYLGKICDDSNMLRTQVNEDAFTLAKLLEWNGEQAAISGRLNGDTIKEWLAESVTIADVTAKHGKEISDALGAQFVKLASPNHGLNPTKAEKILTNVFNGKDADSTTGLRVMLRLQAIRDKVENSEANKLEAIWG